MVDRRTFLGNSLAVFGAARVFAADTNAAIGATVQTASGKIRGITQNKINAFLGVPYGASTAGAGRCMPPVKPQPWTGVKDTVELGPASPQVPSMLIPEAMAQQPKNDGNGNEDCLRLNVWTPSTGNGKRPVMLWLHGGGFSAGSSNWAMYNGANLAAKHDVVVVTVTHRLNVFGYLYLADIGGAKYASASNVGMLDIVEALKWVRDNISQFGGDPKNVTIFGQSGGGGKVCTLLGMPEAKGLFHRAIAMSGSLVRGATRDRASKGAEALMAQLNLKPNQVDELQKIPQAQLLQAMRATQGLQLNPVTDGRTLPADPFDPTATAISSDVPLMIGSTETEVTWSTATNYDPPDDAGLRARVKAALRGDDAQADKVIAVYRKNRPKASNLDLALIIETDVSNFRTGTDTIADRKAAAVRAAVYKYYFQWYSPVRDGKPRSFHTLDIPFAFQNVDIAQSMTGTGKERYALADKMSAAWVAFARSGNPNHKGLPKWEPFTTPQRATMIFNNECKGVNDPFRDERAALGKA
jgi:para-nitrobenzyl esterase